MSEMEVGSFIELQFTKGKEFYKGDANIARLNSGRCAIWHAFRTFKSEVIWLPYYQCDTVRNFLKNKNVRIKYYHIDKLFNPIDLDPQENEVVLLVNYYGIMSSKRMEKLANKYRNVIIDNSQAFFSQPIASCMNVYSCRKFIGVPDGAYVIGKGVTNHLNEYQEGFSSDTSLFLLQRIEYGCEGKAYQSRSLNEDRIDNEDCMRMSKLTRTILDGTDYNFIIEKRKENFKIACELLDKINCILPERYMDDGTVPMVYPLVIEEDDLIKKLHCAKHFQGHWWSYLCEEMPKDTVEYWLSRYIIPITIDQRYGMTQLERIAKIFYT